MGLPLWKLVSDIERREIYADVVHNLAKKEKEQTKALRKKNQDRLADILDQMTKIDYKTTWEQAQQMLLDNPAFADDDELLAMDKEDALVTFEDHIRELEKEWEMERDKEKKRTKRLQRKNRDAARPLQVLCGGPQGEVQRREEDHQGNIERDNLHHRLQKN